MLTDADLRQLAQAVEAFEARFAKVENGPIGSALADGTPYRVITCGGVKKEGEGQKIWATTVAAAIEYWSREAWAFSGDSTELYWRERPQMEMVYMRPCLSDGSIPERDVNYMVPMSFVLIYSRFVCKGAGNVARVGTELAAAMRHIG